MKQRLLILLLALLPMTAWAQQSFISDVKLLGANTYDEISGYLNKYKQEGWQVVNYDLNRNASGDYIYLIYKTETPTDGRDHNYITDFLIYMGTGCPDKLNHSLDYYIVPCDGSSYFKSMKGELNSHADGAYIHLYYRKQVYGEMPSCVTSISFNSNSANAVGAINQSGSIDLNQGAGGDYIYMHFTKAELQPVWEETENGREVNLSRTYSDIYFPYGEYKFSGRLPNNVKLSLEGGTATFNTVSISPRNGSSNFAGFTLAGDATIILESHNNVEGFSVDYPGIFVPKNRTLTIKGPGMLSAYCGGSVSSGKAAAIGGGNGMDCGNIVIEGGQITARGGFYVNGIGNGTNATCGTITLSWSNESDYILSNNYPEGKVQFKRKFRLDGTNTEATVDNINNTKIVPLLIDEADVLLLEAIKSTGAQAFNTYYTHKANTKIVMDCDVVQDHQSSWEALFGGRMRDYCNNAFCFFSRTDGQDIPCFNRTGNEPRGTGFVYGERITIVASGQTATWYRATDPDNVAGSVTTTGTPDDGKTPMLLFNLNTSGTPGGIAIDTSPSVMTLYGCKIYEDETLVRDFVPAVYQNVVGLYDRVTKTFEGSLTSTPFEGVVKDIEPWGEKEGGWCGRAYANGGKNVYYTITKNGEGKKILTISKNPYAWGDNFDIEDFTFPPDEPLSPWTIYNISYDTDGSVIGYGLYVPADYTIIEEGMTGIGNNAFYASYSQTYVIPSSVTKVGVDAFFCSDDAEDVYCFADPNKLTWNDRSQFSFNYKGEKTKMHVYPQYLSTYEQRFGDVNVIFVGDLEDDINYIIDGVGSVTVGKSNDAWYTLDGVKLNGEPSKPGIYINGGRKVMK